MMWMSAGDFKKKDGPWDIAQERWSGTTDAIRFEPTGSNSAIMAKRNPSWKKNGRRSTISPAMSHGRAAFTGMATNIRHGARDEFIMACGEARPFNLSIRHQPGP